MTGYGYGFVLDDSVLEELGRRDLELHQLLIAFDEAHIRTSVPAIALAAAEAALSPDQRRVIRGLLTELDHIQLEVISTQAESARLSEVMAQMEAPADMAAAHTIAVSQYLDWPILTVNLARWDQIKGQLPWRLQLIEVADLDED